MARRPGLYPLDRAVPDPRLTPITPEADMGLRAVGALEDDEGAFARLREVGRLLDTVRIVEQLRELGTLEPGQLRDLGQWVEGGGLAGGQMQWPNAFWDSRQAGDALDDLGIRAGNLGPSETFGNRGSGFGMDWRDYDTTDERGSRDPFGAGRWGLAAEGSPFVWVHKPGADPVRLQSPYFHGGDTQFPVGAPDAGVDAGSDAGADAGRDAGTTVPGDAGDGRNWLGDHVEVTEDPTTGEPLPSDFQYFYREGATRAEDSWIIVPRGSASGVGRGGDAGTPVNPDDAAPVGAAALLALLRLHHPAFRVPGPSGHGGGPRVRPTGASEIPRGGPRLVIGGLADEPLRHGPFRSARHLQGALARIRSTVDPSSGRWRFDTED